MRPDLYAVLGVPRDATQADIRHAYRTLLRRYHPDTRHPETLSLSNSSGATDLQQVLSAYAVLGDPSARADYDTLTARRSPVPKPPQDATARPGAGRAKQPPIRAGPVRWHSS